MQHARHLAALGKPLECTDSKAALTHKFYPSLVRTLCAPCAPRRFFLAAGSPENLVRGSLPVRALYDPLLQSNHRHGNLAQIQENPTILVAWQ